jgi:hypothetical protein
VGAVVVAADSDVDDTQPLSCGKKF